jgi:hypothetical protein
VAIAWSNDDVDFIRRRYDRIGSLHKVFDWLLFLPTKLRRTAPGNRSAGWPPK